MSSFLSCFFLDNFSFSSVVAGLYYKAILIRINFFFVVHKQKKKSHKDNCPYHFKKVFNPKVLDKRVKNYR